MEREIPVVIKIDESVFGNPAEDDEDSQYQQKAHAQSFELAGRLTRHDGHRETVVVALIFVHGRPGISSLICRCQCHFDPQGRF